MVREGGEGEGYVLRATFASAFVTACGFAPSIRSMHDVALKWPYTSCRFGRVTTRSPPWAVSNGFQSKQE